jgi:hypothetical protein
MRHAEERHEAKRIPVRAEVKLSRDHRNLCAILLRSTKQRGSETGQLCRFIGEEKFIGTIFGF